MRWLAGLLAALWCAAGTAPADGLDLSVKTGAGFLYGLAKELVFDGTFAISELDWQLQPVFFEETSLDVRSSTGLHAAVRVLAGIPAASGIMTDSDWLNYPVDNTNTIQTNYSRSNCFTDRAIFIDARVGWEIPAEASLTVEPFLYAGYMSWKWSGRDGYLQYPPGGTSAPNYPPYTTDPPVTVYGTGIVYDQTWLIPGAGVRMAMRLSGGWTVNAMLTFSPWLYCAAFDTHVFRQLDFADTMWGGWMIEPEAAAVFSLSPRTALSVDASFRHIATVLGSDVETATGPGAGTQTISSGAGASFDALSVSLTFSLAL